VGRDSTNSVALISLALAGAVCALCAQAALAGDFQTKKLSAVFSASETAGQGGSTWTINWNLDAEWVRSGESSTLSISLDSDYSKSPTSQVDRLRTAFRVLGNDYGKELRRWYPVYLVQTEGDHSLRSVHTIVAVGYRQQRRHGFLELTLGASKDVRTARPWVGDIGVELAYDKPLNEKWVVGTRVKGEFAAIGKVGLRPHRTRYSWDLSLDYKASEKLGLGYRLWLGNTVPNSYRSQWIGITYTYK